MKLVEAACNSQKPFDLIRDTSGRRLSVRAIEMENLFTVHSKDCREYFKDQFSRLNTVEFSWMSSAANPWEVSFELEGFSLGKEEIGFSQLERPIPRSRQKTSFFGVLHRNGKPANFAIPLRTSYLPTWGHVKVIKSNMHNVY